MYSKAEMVLCVVVWWDCNVLDNTAAGLSWFEGVVSRLDNLSTTEGGGLDLQRSSSSSPSEMYDSQSHQLRHPRPRQLHSSSPFLFVVFPLVMPQLLPHDLLLVLLDSLQLMRYDAPHVIVIRSRNKTSKHLHLWLPLSFPFNLQIVPIVPGVISTRCLSRLTSRAG
jgi:hypothetical protein